MSESNDLIEVDKMSIDQLAGAVVLVLGAVGSLLLVIWQSRCACRCRIGCSDKCYIFDCSREPPPDEAPKEDETLVPPEDEEPDSRPVAQYNTRRRPEEPAENAE